MGYFLFLFVLPLPLQADTLKLIFEFRPAFFSKSNLENLRKELKKEGLEDPR
jgi:hypothetical protein